MKTLAEIATSQSVTVQEEVLMEEGRVARDNGMRNLGHRRMESRVTLYLSVGCCQFVK